MFKLLVAAATAVLMTACAGPFQSADDGPPGLMYGSTAAGESRAAELGFHGPVYRTNKPAGPN